MTLNRYRKGIDNNPTSFLSKILSRLMTKVMLVNTKQATLNKPSANAIVSGNT